MIGAKHTPTHLGSGLFLGDAADEDVRPRASRLGPNRWRAEISGISAGAIIRSWSSPETFATKDEALAAAIAKAEA